MMTRPMAEVQTDGRGHLEAEQVELGAMQPAHVADAPNAMTKAPMEPSSGHGLGSMMW